MSTLRHGKRHYAVDSYRRQNECDGCESSKKQRPKAIPGTRFNKKFIHGSRESQGKIWIHRLNDLCNALVQTGWFGCCTQYDCGLRPRVLCERNINLWEDFVARSSISNVMADTD